MNAAVLVLVLLAHWNKMFQDTYVEAEKLFSSYLNDWGVNLAAFDALHPVWVQILSDPFLR